MRPTRRQLHPPRRPRPRGRRAATTAPRRGVALLAAVAIAAGLVGGGAGAALTATLDDNGTATAPVSSGTSLQGTNSKTSTPAADGSVEAGRRAGAAERGLDRGRAPAGSGGEGTGIVLSADGLILTNNHVVADAGRRRRQLSVTLNDGTHGRRRRSSAATRSPTSP